jgi:hypothetical protein
MFDGTEVLDRVNEKKSRKRDMGFSAFEARR